MITRRLLRRLATASSNLKPLAYPVSRSDPHNVLNMDPNQVTRDIDLEYKRYKMTNYETKIRVNHFLQAVFSHDIKRAVELLGRFREKCTNNKDSDSYIRNVEVYVSCMSTLLMYASSRNTRMLSAPEILPLLCEVLAVPSQVATERTSQLRNLHIVLITVILKTLGTNSTTSKRHNLITQAQVTEFARSHHISVQEIYDYLKTHYPELIPQLNSVWKTRMPTLELDETPTLNIEKYLNDDNSMSFDGMCDFLETERFDASKYDTKKESKLHEIYANLDDLDRKSFMSEYLQFNKHKQLIVEKYCEELQTTGHTKRAEISSTQHIMSLPWISKISDRMSLRILSILSDEMSDDPVSKAVLQHSFLFQQIPKDVIIAIVLNMLIQRSASGGQDIAVLSLTRQMSHVLKSYVRRNKVLVLISNSELFLNDEDLLVLFGALLKLAVENSRMDSSLLRSFVSSQDECFSDVPDQLFVLGLERWLPDTPKYKRAGVIKAHPYITLQPSISKEVYDDGALYFPMVYPPKPWSSPNSGGFLNDLAPFVRTPEPEMTAKYLAQAHMTGQLKSTYESLNALGELPWMINEDVLNIFNEVLGYNEGFLNIPTSVRHKMKDAEFHSPDKSSFPDEESYQAALYLHMLMVRKFNQEVGNLKSQRSYYGKTAKLANALSTHGEILFYPQTLDFRGRVYPAVSLLSNQSEDLVRSLLCFWEPKPLGKNGFKWLQYQLANLYSKNFMSMEELMEFVRANEKNIRDSAASPLDGEKWWTHGDSPWQALALCKEITNVWNYELDIESYMCRTPIHMDGTCNGLQHYAALGKNVQAARSVNLLPSEKKNDVYITVLGLVRDKIQQDLGSSDQAILSLAQILQPYLSRKTIKQTVMTTVYGVTFYGAFRQISNKIDDIIEEDMSVTIPKKQRSEISLYIARHVLSAVGDLFGEARAIQTFLIENAYRCITSFDRRFHNPSLKTDFFGKDHYRPMMWTSLAGFPVIQHYHEKHHREIRTALQQITLRKTTSKSTVNLRKQMNAMAPNFIHSLDAIHLLMTNLAAKSQGIAFAAVHDSFWTHPRDVETLNQLIRQEFVRLHSSGVLENLHKDLEHINRQALQLVWVENHLNQQFLKELSGIRLDYPESPKSRKSRFNHYLGQEFMDNLAVTKLVEIYDPKLIFQSNGRGEGVVYNSNAEMVPAQDTISLTTHTPILVEIRLMLVPNTGNLNLEEVLQSEFFFS